MTLSHNIRSTVIVSSFLAVVAAEAAETVKAESIVPMWAMFHWLSNPAVQDELRLSQDQRAQLVLLTKEYRAATASPKARDEIAPDERASWNAERSKVLEKVNHDFRPKVDKVLSTDQQNRLKEIYIQSVIWLDGPVGAVSEPIAGAIGLADDQKAMLRQIRADWYRTLGGLKVLATKEERAARACYALPRVLAVVV